MTLTNKNITLSLLKVLKAHLEEHGFNPTGVTSEELDFQIAELEGSLNSYQITSVHADDLYGNGLCPLGVTPETYERLASKMADDYCEQLFHTSLVIIAEDGFDIPSYESIVTWLLGMISDMLDGGGEVALAERLKLENTRRVLSLIEANLDLEVSGEDTITVESFTEAYNDFRELLSTYNDKHWVEEFDTRAPALLDFIQVRFSN